MCLPGGVNHTQHRTISHSGLGIVAKVKLNQSHACVWCAIVTLITRKYALFVKRISAWFVVKWCKGGNLVQVCNTLSPVGFELTTLGLRSNKISHFKGNKSLNIGRNRFIPWGLICHWCKLHYTVHTVKHLSQVESHIFAAWKFSKQEHFANAC